MARTITVALTQAQRDLLERAFWTFVQAAAAVLLANAADLTNLAAWKAAAIAGVAALLSLFKNVGRQRLAAKHADNVLPAQEELPIPILAEGMANVEENAPEEDTRPTASERAHGAPAMAPPPARDEAPPEAPHSVGVIVIPNGSGEHVVNLSWTPVVEATGYRVYRDGELRAVVKGPTSTYYKETLTDDITPPDYQVQAYNEYGESHRGEPARYGDK